jgi:hypothetical protein
VIALRTTATPENRQRRGHQAPGVGIQVISFDAATSKQYVDKAYDVAWTNLIKASPTYGPQMKRLFSR